MNRWGWLFDLEVWMMRNDRVTALPWRLARKPVSALTRRLERRGRMFGAGDAGEWPLDDDPPDPL